MDETLVKLGKRVESNIGLVAALVTYGGKIDRSGIDRSDSRHIRFTVVGEEKTLCEAEDAWYSSSDKLKAFYENLKDVKSMLYP